MGGEGRIRLNAMPSAPVNPLVTELSETPLALARHSCTVSTACDGTEHIAADLLQLGALQRAIAVAVAVLEYELEIQDLLLCELLVPQRLRLFKRSATPESQMSTRPLRLSPFGRGCNVYCSCSAAVALALVGPPMIVRLVSEWASAGASVRMSAGGGVLGLGAECLIVGSPLGQRGREEARPAQRRAESEAPRGVAHAPTACATTGRGGIRRGVERGAGAEEKVGSLLWHQLFEHTRGVRK